MLNNNIYTILVVRCDANCITINKAMTNESDIMEDYCDISDT